jgi:hypothetical protein
LCSPGRFRSTHIIPHTHTHIYIYIGFPQNNYPSAEPSATSPVTRSPQTQNNKRTGTHPDSIELAREYARTDCSDLSFIQLLSFVGSSARRSAATGGHLGASVGHGGTYPNPSMASGESKIETVPGALLICCIMPHRHSHPVAGRGDFRPPSVTAFSYNSEHQEQE